MKQITLQNVSTYSTGVLQSLKPFTSRNVSSLRPISIPVCASQAQITLPTSVSNKACLSLSKQEETQSSNPSTSLLSLLQHKFQQNIDIQNKPLLAALAAMSAALLLPTGAAHASEILGSLTTNASAFIPGLVGDDPFREGFVSAFLLIFFSEIGDKTFFIALLLALQQPKSYVFAGTFGALAVMTVISVGLGQVLHEIDEIVPTFGLPLDDLLAVALLIWFGVQTLLSASEADDKAEEEREEAKEVVDNATSSGEVTAAALGMIASTFALVFAAEWGDKSFLATIALSAASSPAGVVAGAVAGHGVATVIAVLGGSFLGQYLSEKVVQYVGGSLFLLFAAATIFDIATGAH